MNNDHSGDFFHPMHPETEIKIDHSGSNMKWYVLALVSLSMFFVSAERMCLPVLFKEIAADLNLSLVQVGTVWGMDPLAGVFVSLFSGLLIDRFGVKRTVTTVIFFTGIFGFLRGLAMDFISLASIMFLFGLIVATSPTVLPKVVALWFQDRHLGLASGIMSTAGSLGGMAASLLSAMVFLPLLGGWRPVLSFFGLPPILLCLMWFTTYGKQSEVESGGVTENAISFRNAFSHVIRIKDVWIIGFFGFGGFGALTGVVGYLSLYLRELGWDPVVAASAMTVLIGSIGLSSIPVSLLSDRLASRKGFLPPILLGLALSLCLLPLVKGLWVWVLIILTGLTYGGLNPLFWALVIETKGVGSTYAGTAFGISVSLGMIGSSISPPLGNSVAYFHLGLPFVLWGVLVGLVLIGFFFLGEKEK
jgi:MFS family permease